MAHPLALRGRLGGLAQLRAARRLLDFQLPVTPERWIGDRDGVAELLREWSATAPGSRDPDGEAVRRYTRAMQLPFVAHTAMEYYRWSLRSLPRRDGRRFADAVRDPVSVPVLQMHGARDPFVLPETAAASRRWAARPGPLRDRPRRRPLPPRGGPRPR